MEIFRKKNEATNIVFPMVIIATPELFQTGVSPTDTAYSSDAEAAFATLAITDTANELGSTGMYEMNLTAAEMNHDVIIIKFTAALGADTAVIIRTRAVDIDDIVRSTTPANTLDVSATGEAGLDWNNIGAPTTAVNLSGTNIDVDQIVASVSGNVDGSVATLTTLTAIPANWLTAAGTAADFGTEVGTAVWATTTRVLTTADWNVGKTGYTCDTTAINGSTTAAAQLALSCIEIESGVAEGTPSVTNITTDLAETQDDIYIGRTVIFTSGNARGEMSEITDYVGTTGEIIVTALANAPAVSDTFIIL